MRLAGIIPDSVVDGPGVRFVVFAQGCIHRCPGCHNPETWDMYGGQEFTVKEVLKKLKKRLKYIQGITLSGGDPFLQAEEMSCLAFEAQKLGLDVVTYTGYIYEELLNLKIPGAATLLEATDILIDGPYLMEYRDLTLAFRGSSNQRIINLKATKENGQLILIA